MKNRTFKLPALLLIGLLASPAVQADPVTAPPAATAQPPSQTVSAPAPVAAPIQLAWDRVGGPIQPIV